MKKILRVLPLLMLIAAVTCAFAFKTAPAKKANTTYGWYVYKGGDRDNPQSYEFDEEFEETSCEGSGDLCAIYADGDNVHPDISSDPLLMQDPNIEEVRKFPAQ